MVLSTHPVPAAFVTVIAVVLGIGVGLEPWRVVVLGVAFLANQVSVGLSNDWIDADRDRAVGRTDKPVAQGLIAATTVRNAAFVTAGLAVLLTLPLGWAATVAHAVFIVSAWSYNAVLKSTALSVAPYIVSFGLLPLIVTLSSQPPMLAAAWAPLAGALLGVSAHFANVLPDLDEDRATGVSGLPHRLGVRASGLVIAGALVGASALVVLGPAASPGVAQFVGLGLSAAISIGCVVLVLSQRISRLLFVLILVGALVNVALLALSGRALLA
ncbi:MAG: 1,4-dihydroxy-2-naphthoate prenyltransferase [Salinibacterium sp.]|nr:MAG: 1,4-dihydroxy-2-naphthoate prenyltransferase [Salinibacterium sp.]